MVEGNERVLMQLLDPAAVFSNHTYARQRVGTEGECLRVMVQRIALAAFVCALLCEASK